MGSDQTEKVRELKEEQWQELLLIRDHLHQLHYRLTAGHLKQGDNSLFALSQRLRLIFETIQGGGPDSEGAYDL